MNILITNDDGYQAKGIRVLAEIMCQFGSVTVIAPKFHQSGMSMAVSLGFRQIGYKKLPQLGPGDWSYLDATPASCVKFAVNLGLQPDVVLSGINHGHNAASASCYSGTLGAAAEAALNGFRAIGVSLAAAYPGLRVTMADVNRRALGLAGANAAANGVADRCGTVESDGFAALAARRFDAVVTNPPIRAGKATIYRMFDETRAHLRPGGALYLVIRKQQGAESCIRYLKTLYARVEKLDRSGGFWVIRAGGALENGGENDVQQ